MHVEAMGETGYFIYFVSISFATILQMMAVREFGILQNRPAKRSFSLDFVLSMLLPLVFGGLIFNLDLVSLAAQVDSLENDAVIQRALSLFAVLSLATYMALFTLVWKSSRPELPPACDVPSAAHVPADEVPPEMQV